MNYEEQTTDTPIGAAPAQIAHVLGRIVSKESIHNLSQIYSVARDANDIEGLLDCFAPDGAFVYERDRVSGREALQNFYSANMRRYRTSLHFTHSHLIELDDHEHANGLVVGHAELSLDDTLVLAAYRYTDRYIRLDSRWFLSERALQFMYAVPIDEMGRSFRDQFRIRWPSQEPSEASIPEHLPSWQHFRSSTTAL